MKWGILATGTIAAKFADTVNQMEKEQVLAACASRTMEKAEAFRERFGIARAYDSYEAMVRDPEVEAVYIATPNNLHYENCVMCLEAGKHVLCEKPFTTAREEGEKLFALAEEKGLFIMEAFWIRFLPALQKMQELIHSGMIGDVVWARSDYGFVAKGARKDRKFDSALAGGALLDIGIYNLGFMRMVMGDAQPESFDSQYHINEYGTDDFSTILLRYPGGRSACVTTSIGMDMPRRAVVYGTKGSICLDDFQHAEKLHVKLADGTEDTIELPEEINGFEYQIREAERCVKAGMTTSDVLKKSDTLEILELMDQIRKSWGMRFACE
ncbi:MAG: Gfo/Idh/MocA family oxidoreductase [Lachnospiraceae bacterium]|nr:Gfo/Idh/MocA family oxidoreductase [Lachnospiraceae bacterium]